MKEILKSYSKSQEKPLSQKEKYKIAKRSSSNNINVGVRMPSFGSFLNKSQIVVLK